MRNLFLALFCASLMFTANNSAAQEDSMHVRVNVKPDVMDYIGLLSLITYTDARNLVQISDFIHNPSGRHIGIKDSTELSISDLVDLYFLDTLYLYEVQGRIPSLQESIYHEGSGPERRFIASKIIEFNSERWVKKGLYTSEKVVVQTLDETTILPANTVVVIPNMASIGVRSVGIRVPRP